MAKHQIHRDDWGPAVESSLVGSVRESRFYGERRALKSETSSLGSPPPLACERAACERSRLPGAESALQHYFENSSVGCYRYPLFHCLNRISFIFVGDKSRGQNEKSLMRQLDQVTFVLTHNYLQRVVVTAVQHFCNVYSSVTISPSP